MNLLDLSVGTIAITKNGDIAIVTGHKLQNLKYPILFKKKQGQGALTYKGSPDDFAAAIGKVDMEKFENSLPAPSPVMASASSMFMPPELAGLKVGDPIKIRLRGHIETCIFQGYAPNRPKNCVSILYKGQSYKGPLSIVVHDGAPAKQGGPAVKRSENEIMEDILGVYCGLSPENLTCDGELSRTAVERRKRDLNARLDGLCRELGRFVFEEEAYAYAEKNREASVQD